MIISVFETNKNSGTMWSITMEKLRGVVKFKGFMKDGVCPCCDDVYKYSEYAAARNLIKESAIIDQNDKNSLLDKSIISPTKFRVGGAAMFPAAIRNHHSVNPGNSDNRPLVK